MKKQRRLRRLAPDSKLIARRAAGESLRALASDYSVTHTTLARFFARPDVAKELHRARRTVAAGRVAARRDESQLRREAKAQRQLAEAHQRAAAYLRRNGRSDPYSSWLDHGEAALPLPRSDYRTPADDRAATVVREDGGIEQVIAATGLHTRENILRSIDPAILVRALDNDALSAVGSPERARLRRLVPDPALVRRRAAGETLRALAADYDVVHTTLSRWFAQPQPASELRRLRSRSRPGRRTARDTSA